MASKIGPEKWNKAYSKVNKKGAGTSATQVADVYDRGAPAPGSATSATQVADVADGEPMPKKIQTYAIWSGNLCHPGGRQTLLRTKDGIP